MHLSTCRVQFFPHSPGVPQRFFELCGKSIRDLSIYKDGIVQKFVTLIMRHCPNVENLSIMAPITENNPLLLEHIVPGLLEQFSSQLRSFEWNPAIINESRIRLPDISMCPHIQELVFPASLQLTSFLHSFAASLESLTAIDGEINEYPEMFNVIEQKCGKLSTLLLTD